MLSFARVPARSLSPIPRVTAASAGCSREEKESKRQKLEMHPFPPTHCSRDAIRCPQWQQDRVRQTMKSIPQSCAFSVFDSSSAPTQGQKPNNNGRTTATPNQVHELGPVHIKLEKSSQEMDVRPTNSRDLISRRSTTKPSGGGDGADTHVLLNNDSIRSVPPMASPSGCREGWSKNPRGPFARERILLWVVLVCAGGCSI